MLLRSFLGIVMMSLCAILQSCGTPEYLPEAELSVFCLDEDHGLTKTVVSKDISIRLTYKPTDLLVVQEMRSFTGSSDDKIVTLRKKYGPYYYFILSLSRSGKEGLGASGNHAEFSELLQTISFRMGEVVNLTTSHDTIPPADFIYNRTFGLSASTDILLVFDKSAVKGAETVLINLDEFGLGVGKQVVEFKVGDLNSAPRVYKD
jgi:hypothetical protein